MNRLHRLLCRWIGCHSDKTQPSPPRSPEHPPPPPPQGIDDVERAYREASHEMRNAVVKLQAAAHGYTTAFDEVARRWK